MEGQPIKSREILRARKLRQETSEARRQVSEARRKTELLLQKLLEKLDAYRAAWEAQPPPDP